MGWVSLQKPPTALSLGIYPEAIFCTNPQKLDHRVLLNRNHILKKSRYFYSYSNYQCRSFCLCLFP
jgi:hypothetical protein